MGLAAIYCHPLEFFLSDLMHFPQTLISYVHTCSAKIVGVVWSPCNQQQMHCTHLYTVNALHMPHAFAWLEHLLEPLLEPLVEAFGCWLSSSPSKWLYWRWYLSGRSQWLSVTVLLFSLSGCVDGLRSDGYADTSLRNSMAMDWPFLISGSWSFALWFTYDILWYLMIPFVSFVSWEDVVIPNKQKIVPHLKFLLS